MRIAIVGGGINGIMSAWAAARAGHDVTLFERGRLMGQTSSSSTKLLHGGLRYLENGEFRLVGEALRERAWWIRQAPHLAKPIRIALPVYAWSRRPAWVVRCGIAIYQALAGRHGLGPSQAHDRQQLLRLIPGLNPDGLLGGFTFWDGQMDDRALGLWAAVRAAQAGISIREDTAVHRVDHRGGVWIADGRLEFDRIVNLAGPWARQLLDQSQISSAYELDLVRGSHLVLDHPVGIGILAEYPGSRRIGFVLPWRGQALVGTTEVRQLIATPPLCSQAETDDILAFHRAMFPNAGCIEPLSSFAGVRPLLRSAKDANKATREYAIERSGALISVFGGKWTTSRALGRRVVGCL
jgi:glycerol-3-phosphate dehydrogenase